MTTTPAPIIVMPRSKARRVYANEEAIRAYTEAIALTPDTDRERFDLLLARAQTYDLVAQPRRAARRHRQSCSVWPRH